MEEASGEDELPFHDAIYLTIVTISTVGYGDFSPNSLLAKVTICGMLAIVFVVVPLQVRESCEQSGTLWNPSRTVRVCELGTTFQLEGSIWRAPSNC